MPTLPTLIKDPLPGGPTTGLPQGLPPATIFTDMWNEIVDIVSGDSSSKLPTAAIEDLAVTTLKVANLAINASKLANSSVETAKLDDLAVTTLKIADGAITLLKMANGTPGAILKFNGTTGVIEELSIGTANQQIRVNAGATDIEYFTPTATGATDLLDGSVHQDTVANAVTQGSLIKGNGTPLWDEFPIGTALQHIRVNSAGTDLEYAEDVLHEIARETLTVAGDTLTVTVPVRNILKIYWLGISTGGTINMEMTFNGDTGANYAYQRQQNGGSWADSINQTEIFLEPGSVGDFQTGLMDVGNTSGQEKVYSEVSVSIDGTGAGTVPERQFLDGKWADNSQITTITIANTGGGDFAIGSTLLVLGMD